MDHSVPEQAYGLLPEVEVRALLPGHVLALRMLRPPYPAVGVGTLRLLRIREFDGRTELVAGYDRYERIDDRGRESAAR